MATFSSIPRGTYDIKPQAGFTSSLMETILVSQSKIEEWVQREKAKADEAAETYRQRLAEEQGTIQNKAASLLAVQFERGLSVENGEDNTEHIESIATRKKALVEQRNVLQSEINQLKDDYKNREKRVKEITLEESKQRGIAEEARSLKEEVEESKKTTVDDLTRGIVNYKHLGLDFEKTNIENELRFHFCQLDPRDPNRKFTFVLQVSDQDKYEIAQCVPPVDVKELIEIANVLNKTDDMAYLARKMRRAFSSTL